MTQKLCNAIPMCFTYNLDHVTKPAQTLHLISRQSAPCQVIPFDKTALKDLECSMDGLECSAVQATKQQYLKLDKNKYHQLELLLFVDYILIKSDLCCYFPPRQNCIS